MSKIYIVAIFAGLVSVLSGRVPEYLQDVYSDDYQKISVGDHDFLVLVKGSEATVKSASSGFMILPDPVRFRREAIIAAEQISGCRERDTFLPFGSKVWIYSIDLDC